MNADHEAFPCEVALFPLSQRLDGLTQRFYGRWKGGLDSDIVEDWRQEAAILLWHIRPRLASLPPAEREPYATACVLRMLRHLLKQEQQDRAQTIAIEDLRQGEGQKSELSSESLGGEAQFFAANWLEDISSVVLYRALKALSARDHVLIDLYYHWEMEDADIAVNLNLAYDAVKKQRYRILGKMRRSLGVSVRPDSSAPPPTTPDFLKIFRQDVPFWRPTSLIYN